MIDLYCERLGPGFWAEPVNAMSNVSFVVAAITIWHQARRRRDSLMPQIWLLLSLIVAIGVGSGLFHTFATGWAQIADVLPILLLQLVFLWIYGRRIMQASVVKLVILTTLYLVAAYLGRQFPQLLNGSIIYAPAVVLLAGLGFYHYRHAARHRSVMLWACGVFVLSLCFRTIDMTVCETFPLGTHFLWHVLNGLVVYLAMYGLMENIIPSSQRPA